MDDADALDRLIGGRLPGLGEPLTIEPMGGDTGAANQLSWVRRGDSTWVLRRPPSERVAKSASDMAREWRILSALGRTTVPHARGIMFGTAEESPWGTPFLLLEKVDGFTPVGILPAPYDVPAGRRALSFALVDALAELALVDCAVPDLEGLGRPDGFLQRQVDRWLGQWHGYRTRDLVDIEFLADWLRANTPATSPVGLLHGDYSPFNVMAAHSDPTRLAAVIDWDMGTVGDPTLDLGHLLARWTEPGEDPVVVNWDIGDGTPETRTGLPSRAELAARYEERTGRSLTHLTYYEVLALFKLALVLEGRVAQDQRSGNAAGEAGWVRMVDRLLLGAVQFARGERL